MYISIHEFEAAKLGEIIELQKTKYYNELKKLKSERDTTVYDLSSKLIKAEKRILD